MEKTKKKVTPMGTWNMSVAKRLAIWRRAQTVLGKKAPAMLKELKKMRQEWK